LKNFYRDQDPIQNHFRINRIPIEKFLPDVDEFS